MSNETARKDHDGGRGRRSGLRKKDAQPAAAAQSRWLLLASSGWFVRIDDVLDQPTTAFLASEDACWQFAREDWKRRRPHLWNRSARGEWQAEARRLEEKRDRLVALTRQVRTLRPQSSGKRGVTGRRGSTVARG